MGTRFRELFQGEKSTQSENTVDSWPRASGSMSQDPLSCSGTFPSGTYEEIEVGDEEERTRLIGEISRALRDPAMPETTRTAGLTLIGWLARRKLSEQAHTLGVAEARESEARMRAARQKIR